MTETKRKKIPMALYAIIQNTVRRMKYFPANSKGAALATELAASIISDLHTFRALQRLTLEEREKSKRTWPDLYGGPQYDPGSLVDPREGRSAASAEPAHASLTPDESSDLHVQPRPKHVRNLSWAHKYYVRCLELAGLVVKARGELKEALRMIEKQAVWQRAQYEEKLAGIQVQAKERLALQDEIRQLKLTIHLLTQGS